MIYSKVSSMEGFDLIAEGSKGAADLAVSTFGKFDDVFIFIVDNQKF